MVCGQAAWKREEVPDHKFDFIDVRDYRNNGWWTQTRYGLVFALVVKSFAVYIADIYTAVTLLAFNHFNGNIYNKVQDNPDNTVPVPLEYGKWVFFGCIIFSFLLLAYEAHKCRAIIRSRDISYAYTNVMANNYYSLRSFDHFCLFTQINNSTKKKDEIAFFIFFTFKGWKRLVVADGPRQVINALTLFGLVEVNKFSTNIYDYYGGSILTAIMLLTMIFTVLVFAISAILLLVASLMYLPLLCYIKGNLKAYCCHKIDKRITELVHIKKKERVAKQAAIARAEAKGDFKHLMNKKGIIVGQKMAQPTLPNVDVDLYSSEKKQQASSLAGSPAFGPMSVKGYGGPYGSRGAAGDDWGSQAHLVLNQGPGGEQMGNGSLSHSQSVSGSMAGDHYGGGGAGGGGQYSLASSAQNSPEVYAKRVYGGQGPASSNHHGATLGSSLSSHANLASQLGPIGTSPQLFAQRGVGREASTTKNGTKGMEGIGRSRSPVNPLDQNASADRGMGGNAWGGAASEHAGYPGQASYGKGRDADVQLRQDTYDNYANGHRYNGANGHSDSGYGVYEEPYDTHQPVHAYNGDLSAYAPYEAVGEVYDFYHAGGNGGGQDSPWTLHDQAGGTPQEQHQRHFVGQLHTPIVPQHHDDDAATAGYAFGGDEGGYAPHQDQQYDQHEAYGLDPAYQQHQQHQHHPQQQQDQHLHDSLQHLQVDENHQDFDYGHAAETYDYRDDHSNGYDYGDGQGNGNRNGNSHGNDDYFQHWDGQQQHGQQQQQQQGQQREEQQYAQHPQRQQYAVGKTVQNGYGRW